MERLICFIVTSVILITSCSPKYFTIMDNQCFISEYLNKSDTNFDHYSFELNPYTFYKYNRESKALLSPNSRLIKNNYLFHFRQDQSVFDDNPSFLDNSFFRADVFIEQKGGDSLQEGQEVVFRTINGRRRYAQCNNCNPEEAKLVYTMKGKVGQRINDKDGLYLLNIDNIWHESAGGIKHIAKDKSVIKFVVSRGINNEFDKKHFIKIHALIDVNFRKKHEHSTIYEFEEVFGEELEIFKI